MFKYFTTANHLSLTIKRQLGESFLDNFMVLNQPWETGWCIKKEMLDAK